MAGSGRLPPMQALRAFEAVARTGSLTRAAEQLHLTHGAIGHQLKALESEVGVRLVERAGRGVRLTDEGERFASRVRGALAELAEAVRELSDRRSPHNLRITVVPSFAARWLLPRIGRFVEAHPEIDVDVRSGAALVDFRREDVDLGIRLGSGDWPGLVAEKMMDEWFFPVCSPRLAGGRLPKRPEDLARFTMLRSEGEPWRPWFEAAGLDWEEPQRGGTFSDSSHVVQAAIDGQGIALARSTLVSSDLASGALVRLFDVAIRSPRTLFLVYPPRLQAAPKLRLFRDWLLGEVRKERHGGALLKPSGGSRARAR